MDNCDNEYRIQYALLFVTAYFYAVNRKLFIQIYHDNKKRIY
jgi:hypothetical protein